MAFGDNPVYYDCPECGGFGYIEGDFRVSLGPEGLVPVFAKNLGTLGGGIDYGAGMSKDGSLVPGYYERVICSCCNGSGYMVEIDLY